MNSALQAKAGAFKKSVRSYNTTSVAQPTRPSSSAKVSSAPSVHGAFRSALNVSNYSSYGQMAELTQQRNRIKSTIIKKLAENHKEGNPDPLTLHELAEECKIEISTTQMEWLEDVHNEKSLHHSQSIIAVPKADENDPLKVRYYYKYKPKFACTDKASLLQLLREHHKDQLGGITRDELLDCMSEEAVNKSLRSLEKAGRIFTIETADQKKKQVYFYNENAKRKTEEMERKRLQETVTFDEEHLKLWNTVVSQDHVTEATMTSYLKKHHLTCVENRSFSMQPAEKKRKKGRKKEALSIPMK